MTLALPRAMQRPHAILCSDDSADVIPRLALLIVLGTVPGLVAGLLGEGTIDAVFHPDGVAPDRIILAIAVASITLALLLLAAERTAQHVRGIDSLTVRDTVIVGLAQTLALIPGVSRSGATITAGLFRGLTRADAARFSFLLGAPIIAAAGAKGLLETLTAGLDAGQLAVFAIGVAASALAGFAAIWGLLRYLQRATTAVFIVYRIVLGIVLIVLVTIR
jgi:undecaprenyl-diphosphatase